ncbi:adenylate/guanylate cyclase domain-containing protein [Motiliproteus sediminis]|uniref:adenylate/guanylate cyclase domain-containing protein n=1 Tax=Motiliproteus sediminis TaxID=1468178 RepID=UPI001AF022CA|nr:adenylate/guanylate cyclase domain-containing protein [Motiliproteus sediminis]
MSLHIADLLEQHSRHASDHRRLPERVCAAIDRHQWRSERLVARIQLAVVLTFSLLYTLSPKTFSAEATFAPVPWVLAAYTLFTLVHLYVCQRRLPSDGFTYLSILVDMALIYLLIWSFHLQYMQPPSFYLKAPTLLYVFIFIALRALRFEVKFILFAGASAAMGWLIMILYVVFADAANTMITKDYVTYLTSNSVLLGAEFDKVVTIVIVTLVLAAAVYRAKRLLVESVVEASVADDLSHFVPDQVMRNLAESSEQPQAGQAKTYDATVMFIDIVGFTSLSEALSPTQVVATLNSYFTAVEQILEQHGGTINQFQGDAILASFDPASGSRSPADDAVRAALAIQRMLHTQQFSGNQLRCRIGINSGSLVGGLMGSSNRLIYTVHGDVVNVAARLEQLNKELGTDILLSESTVNACCTPELAFEPRGDVRVKGRHQPVALFSITATKPNALA